MALVWHWPVKLFLTTFLRNNYQITLNELKGCWSEYRRLELQLWWNILLNYFLTCSAHLSQLLKKYILCYLASAFTFKGYISLTRLVAGSWDSVADLTKAAADSWRVWLVLTIFLRRHYHTTLNTDTDNFIVSALKCRLSCRWWNSCESLYSFIRISDMQTTRKKTSPRWGKIAMHFIAIRKNCLTW